MISVLAPLANADIFSLTKAEQEKIFNEAENWIDAMPDGLQDKISDAVAHSQHGFYAELNLFRNIADTTGIGKYRVNVTDLQTEKGVKFRWYAGNGSTKGKKPLLVYFHGGGWSMGSVATTDKFCRALASEGNVNVISVEYPLVPEYPYPAGILSSVETVEYIFKEATKFGTDSHLISLGGDGAGGNVAMEVSLRLPEKYKVKSLVLYYPLVQTTGILDPSSKREFGRGYGFDSRVWEAYISVYNNKSRLDYGKLPPLLVISAGRDIVAPQGKALKSAVAGSKHVIFEGALHGFLTDGQQNTAFTKAVAITDHFLTG